MESKAFVAIGEEANRGTKEATTVGFIPLTSFKPVKPDFMAKKRNEFRGDSTPLGPTTEIRMGQKWDGLELESPFFTEAGTTKGMLGTELKHFFGKVTSSQNGGTGQYRHMLYAVADPFATANLGTKALSLNMNLTEGATLKNYPYIGGRPQKIGFSQKVGEHLLFKRTYFGQKLDTVTAGLGSPVFPAENLRCDYNNLRIWTGVVTRTGSAPDYTKFASAATAIVPDEISLELERGYADKLVLNNTDTPGKTGVGVLTGKLSMSIDWEDPASGFSSVDDFAAWLAGTSALNILLIWDTGTQAGTGDNHSLMIDLPICNRLGGMPEFSIDKDPVIKLEYDLHYDPTTCLYSVGMILNNTASAL